MRILTAFGLSAALLGAACTPMTSPASVPTMDATVPVQSAEAGACAARGGEIRRVGRMQSQQCILKYTDAKKPCTDGDQCQGDCRAAEGVPVTEGREMRGQCTADSDRFGCHTTIEDGKATATLCID